MTEKFEIVEATIFDDMVLDKDNRPIRFVPFTPTMKSDVFDKYVVFRIKGEAGTYPASMKLESADGYNTIKVIPTGPVMIETNKVSTLTVRATVNKPLPGGGYRIVFYLGDASIGEIKFAMPFV